MTDLGYKPLKGKLLLSDGADWVCTLSTGEVWPSGTAVWCQIGEQRWDAIVTPVTGTAAFTVESDVTDSIASGTPYTVYLQFPGAPSVEYAWFEDVVRRTR